MELRILEYVAAVCMGLSIARPLVRGLWKLPGLAACPFIALGIVAGIFPAYGFRPECIPLLLFALFLFSANLPDFRALFAGLQSDTYRDKGPLFTFGTAGAFIFVMWITVSFSPSVDDLLVADGVETVFLRERKLHVRIYHEIEPEDVQAENAGADAAVVPQNQDEPGVVMVLADEAAATPEISVKAAPGRPLLMLVPPVAGSFTVSDQVCAALRDKGFTVLAFSRAHFDSPFFEENGKPLRLSVSGLFRLFTALTQGTSNTAGNDRGRLLEDLRKEDILYLLKELPVNKTLLTLLDDADTSAVFLAGYGAGGAALTTLAGLDTFGAQFPHVRGIIAIEAPLLSSLESDPAPPPPPPAADPISALFRAASIAIKNNSPRKITHSTGIPRLRLPCLFLVSDKVTQKRTGRYETILAALEQSGDASLLAAFPGAGPLDYSASPGYYPLLSALFRGTKQPWRRSGWTEQTASIIANFAVLTEKNNAAKSPAAETIAAGTSGMETPAGTIPPNGTDGGVTQPEPPALKTRLTTTALDQDIYLEQGGGWHIPDTRTILLP